MKKSDLNIVSTSISLLLILLLTACSTSLKNSEYIEVKEQINHTFKSYSFDKFSINQPFPNNELSVIKNSRIDDCFMAHKQSTDDDIEFQIMNNKIAIISSSSEKRSSYTGVKIGDDEDTIYLKHPSNKFEKLQNPYGNPQKDYSIIFWSDDSRMLGIRYDIENRKIITIQVGNENLTLMEGCA